MAWPSKDPDDYLGRPLYVPSPPIERRPLVELDPVDWRIGVPTLAFAPVAGVPWLVTLTTALLVTLCGAALAGAVTTSERWQTLGLLLALMCAPLPSWLLERTTNRAV